MKKFSADHAVVVHRELQETRGLLYAAYRANQLVEADKLARKLLDLTQESTLAEIALIRDRARRK